MRVRMAFRLDRGTLRPAKRTPTGVRADAFISTIGVFEYTNPDGSIRREYRPPEEVFHPESLASFAGVPVTNDHPAKRVDTTNAREVMRGVVGEHVRQDGDRVAATLFINDADLIARMDAGKCEISCGYDMREDWTPGISPDGKPYDLIQRDIRGNHTAVVNEGRQGPEIRARMDAAEQTDNAAPRGMRTDHMEFEKLYKEAVQTAATEKARADKAEGERDAAVKRADTAEGERDSAKKRVDEAEKLRTDAADPKRFDERVNARVALIKVAESVLRTDGKPDDLSTKTGREIKVAFVKRVDGVEIAADKSDDYVSAYFESASKRVDTADKSRADVRILISGAPGARVDSSDGDIETKAREAMQHRSDNAWRTPVEPVIEGGN